MNIQGLWQVYDNLISNGDFLKSIMSISQAIGGIGALLYIAYRVFSSLAKAEPIDTFSLLRPFAIGLCIMFFPNVILNPMNGVFKKVDEYFQSKGEEANKKTQDKILMSEAVENKKLKEFENQVSNDTYDKIKAMAKGDYIKLNKTNVEELNKINSDSGGFFSWFSGDTFVRGFLTICRWCYMAVSTIIRVMSVFYLVILSLVGPLAFAFSIFDGFQSSLSAWFARYINFSLWGVICSILDIFLSSAVGSVYTAKAAAMSESSDAVHLASTAGNGFWIFLIYMLGILCYLQVPKMAGWIVSAGGGSLGVGSSIARGAGAVGGAVGGIVGMGMASSIGASKGAAAAMGSFSKPDEKK